MANRRRGHRGSPWPFYIFALIWLLGSGLLPIYAFGVFLIILGLSLAGAFFAGKVAASRDGRQETARAAQQTRQSSSVRRTDAKNPAIRKSDAPPAPVEQTPAKKSYGPEIDPILQEGNRALSEMGRLYTSIKDPEIRKKINEIMRITDKIVQDAIQDPSDIPQIKKFMNYYLPTTIKLLNAYDRMSAQGIEGDNLNKSMNSINEMLDAAIVAYKKRLDSLFANQALDIETDIQVMNTMLAREGLIGEKDFQVAGSN